MDQDREERVRARAYEIWEREGRQEGSHEAHWQQAERELQEESGERQQGAIAPQRLRPGLLAWRVAFSQSAQRPPPGPGPALARSVPAAEAPRTHHQERRERSPDSRISARAGWWRGRRQLRWKSHAARLAS